MDTFTISKHPFPHVFPSLQVGFQPGSGEHWLGSVLILALIHFAPHACLDLRNSFGTKEAASGHITPALKSCLVSKCWDNCWKETTMCLKTLHSLGLPHPGPGSWETLEASSLGKTTRSSIPLPSPHAFGLDQSFPWRGVSSWSHPTSQIHRNLSLPGCQVLPGFFF